MGKNFKLIFSFLLCLLGITVGRAQSNVARWNGTDYETLQAAFDAAEAADPATIEITLLADAELEITARANVLSIGTSNTQSIVINGGNHTLTFNQKNSDWNDVSTANDAVTKLVLNNMTITNSNHNDGPWNRHDINFSCAVELNNVTSDKAMAFKNAATLNDVTVTDTGDIYGIWIQPNGQNVSIDGLTLTVGRGIKIDDQYVVNNSQKVTLDIANATFNTTAKSAILVKNTTGADINAGENIDIINVAADKVNLVWCDEDYPQYFDQINVTGATAIVEKTIAKIGNNFYKTIADAVAAATAGQTIEIFKAGDYTLPNISKNVTVEGTVDGVVFNHIVANPTNENNIASIPNGATFKNVTFNFGNVNYHGFTHAGTINMEGCTLNGRLTSYGDMNFTNCEFNQTNSDYHMWAYAGNLTYTDCTFTNTATGKFLNVYNESGATKYTVTVNNCKFVNETAANKAALNVKATSGSNVLAYDVIINDCTTEGAFPEANWGDKLVVLNSVAQVDDRTSSGIDNITVTQDGVLIYPHCVAQIGDAKYPTLQSAVDAAQQIGGEVTINIIDDISGETVTIQEVANLQLTIDGQKDASSNYTVDAIIIVDGLRGNSGSPTNGASVTLQNIAFVNGDYITAQNPSGVIKPSHYPHHLTIQNCTYIGKDTDASRNIWFLDTSDAPLYDATIKDVTVEHSRLIQGSLGLNVLFENIIATNDVKSGFNIKTEGTVLIKNCQVTTPKYAFRDYKDAYVGTITLEGNTFISTSEESDEGAVVNRGGAVGTGHINVVSGTYTGHVKVLNGKEGVLAISGGYFSEEFPQDYIAADLVAAGKDCVPATDKEGYYTIGDPTYVAQIGSTKYTTLQKALDAAYEMTGDVTVTLLADITESAVARQKANLNITIEGAEKTLTGQILIDGKGFYGDDVLTIQNIKFTGNTSNVPYGDNAFISVAKPSSLPAPYSASRLSDAHNVIIKNCDFTSTSTSLDIVGFRAQSGANLKNITISNCTGTNLHSLAQLVGTNGGSITNNTIDNSENFANVNGGAGEFTVSGNTFTCAEGTEGYGIRENAGSSAVINLTDNTFTATKAVVLGKSKSATNGTINVVSGTYVGDIVKDIATTATGKIVISDGKFSAPIANAQYADFIAEGKCGVNGLYPEEEFAKNGIGDAVATVTNGETTIPYASLEAAFAAAVDGSTVTLLADAEGNGIIAPEGKFTTGVTVDFGGFTYAVTGNLVGSSGTQTQGFQLLKDNKITFKNGTITSEKAKILVQNYSDLTLEGMTLTLNNAGYSSAYTLSNNNGNIVIDGSTINANPAGGFAFDVCRYSTYPSVNVTVKGASVINGNIEVSASGNDPKDGFGLTLEAGTFNGNIVLDASAKAVLNSTPEKAVITKSNSLTSVAAPQDFKWVDNGNETSTLKPCVYVAQIGEVKYESLTAATNAAQKGETIELLADITTETGNKSLKEGVTLDGKGKTISGDIAIYISKNGGTIQNVNFKNIHNAAKKKSAVYSEYLEGTATITGCTFDNCDWDAIQIIPVAGGNVVITNNTFSDDNEDGITQKRYIHIQSAQNVDFSATITENVMTGNNGGPMDVYYPTDKTKVNLTNNYIEVVDDVLCILVADNNGFAGELAFPAYTTADKEETYSPEAYIQNDLYSAKFYMTFAEAVPNDGNGEKVISLVTNVAEAYTMSEGQTLKVKKNGKTFKTPIAPDGFVVSYSTADGVTTYTVVEADIEYTAANGTVKYMLYSSTMVSSDGTYKLLKDVSTTARLAPGIMASNITLDLNGHTLTSTATDCAILLSRAGSATSPKSFSLVDTSEDGEGTLAVNPDANIGIQVSGKYNNVTIGEGVTIDGDCVALLSENQTLTVNGTINGGNDFAIATNGSATKNATININEGAVLTSDITAVYLPGTGTTTISGGTITGSNGIYVKSGVLNITGGEITGNGEATEFVHNPNGTSSVGAALVVENCGYPGGAPTVNVTGGTFTSTNADAIASYSYGENEPIAHFVHGGYFSSELDREICEVDKKCVPSTVKEGYYELGDIIYVAKIGEVKYESLAEAVEAVQDGETIVMIADVPSAGGMSVPSGKNFTVDFDGHTYTLNKPGAGSTGTETSGFQLLMNSTITFKNGTINISEENLTAAVAPAKNIMRIIQNYANLTLDNMTIDGTNQYGGKDYVLSYNNGTSVIKDTKIIAGDDVIAFDVCRYSSYPSVNVTVQGTSEINGNIEVYAGGGDPSEGMYLTVEGGTINGELILSEGGATAIVEHDDKAKVKKNNDVDLDAPADFKWRDNNDGTSTLVPCEYICAIGTTKYETLAEAVAAAGTSATTITLLTEAATDDGVISGDGVVVPSGSNITFDLNGLTYNVSGETVGSSGTETQGFQLLKDSDVKFQNGTLKATAATAQIIIQNYSNLTLENVILDGTELSGWAYALSNNTGTINLTGSTSIIAKEGGVAFDTYKSASYPNPPTVNINTTGEISGPIEVTGGKLNIENGKFDVTWVTDSHYAAGDIQITGGIYTAKVTDEYIAAGYICTDNPDDATKAQYPYAVMTMEDGGEFDLYDLANRKDDKYPYLGSTDLSNVKVTYHRYFSDNQVDKYQAWFVPMDYTIKAEDLENFVFWKIHMVAGSRDPQGGEVDESNEDNKQIWIHVFTMKAGDVLKGNRPYVIVPKAAGDFDFAEESTKLYPAQPEPTSHLKLSTSYYIYDFYGTYEQYVTSKEGEIIAMGGGYIRPNVQGGKLGIYRWYIKASGNEFNDDYSNFRIGIVADGEEDPTSIFALDGEAEGSDEISGIYSVNGTKYGTTMDDLQKGVNIIRYKNGTSKKVLVK